jgi:hypothetical protein
LSEFSSFSASAGGTEFLKRRIKLFTTLKASGPEQGFIDIAWVLCSSYYHDAFVWVSSVLPQPGRPLSSHGCIWLVGYLQSI